MDAAFDAGELGRRYMVLDQLPPTLYADVVAHPHGSLLSRVRGVLAWRGALLAGQLPDEDLIEWPAPQLKRALLKELNRLNIARFCKGQPELTDELMLDIIRSVEDFDTTLGSRWQRMYEELQELERLKHQKARQLELEKKAVKKKRTRNTKDTAATPEKSDGQILEDTGTGADGEGAAFEGDIEVATLSIEELDKETLEKLYAEARRLAEEHLADEASKDITKKWEKRVRIWAELSEVFGELGDLVGRGWDLSLGLIHSAGWLEMVRLRKLIEQLPALREVIRALGRLQSNPEKPEEPPVSERIFREVRRADEEQFEVRSPFAPTETRGVTRSDNISRMLPCESVLLGHPILRMLWHVRHTEHSLLTYKVEGVMVDHSITELDLEEELQLPGPPPVERGPILVCVDTSGSMDGTPGTVAKAIALEAMRVAYQEKRACYLFSFSGPAQVLEHSLSLTPEGLGNLLTFLSYSFSGGTDVAEPLRRATARLEKDEWNRADILILSDGEFPVETKTVSVLKEAHERFKTRVHGILIGSQYRESMDALCDHLHVFTEWSALLGMD